MLNLNYKPSKVIAFILIAGLVIRLAFLFWGASVFYGSGSEFTNNDSFSYTNSFLNLLNHGVFSFDLTHPDAYFGRLPGYPFFWGIHYLIFGPELVYWGVAITQIALDVAAIFLLYHITLTVSRSETAGLATAFLYAFYPFIIVWTTVSGTELLASFITIFFFYWLTCKPVTYRNAFITALIAAVAFYIREYLGVLIVSAGLYYLLELKLNLRFIKTAAVLGLTFILLYAFWPIRNYISFGRIIPLKTQTSGYHRYGADIVSARAWLYSWTTDADNYITKISQPGTEVAFPDHIFADNQDRLLADSLVQLARTCGSGFYNWANNKKAPFENNCNTQIEAGFIKLQKSYRNHQPLAYHFEVPLQNLKKGFFKNELTDGSHNLLTQLLFSYRSVLLLLALGGILVNLKNRKIYPILFFPAFMYFFICFLFRQVEMRYLIQADVMLLIFSGLFIQFLLARMFYSNK